MKFDGLFPPEAGEPRFRDWVWCLHCECVHSRQDWESNHLSCPHPNCGGTPLAAWPWEEFRANHPDYPEVPVAGAYYPMC